MDASPLTTIRPDLAGAAWSGRPDELDARALREAEGGDPLQVAQAGRQLESLFARLLVRELRRALPEGPFGGGAGADVFEGWFDEHLGNALVERDALGLAGLVKTGIGRAARPGPATETTDATEGGGA